MPQFDPRFFISQLFWAMICFSLVFGVFGMYILPKIKRNIARRDEEKRKIAAKIDEFYQEVDNINFSKIQKIRQVDHAIKEDLALAEQLGRKALRAKKEILDTTFKAELQIVSEMFDDKQKLAVLDEIGSDRDLQELIEKKLA